MKVHAPSNYMPDRILEKDDATTVMISADHKAEGTAQGSTGDRIHAHYAIRDRIGDGGMGIVYLAKDRKLDRYVAIKRLNNKALSVPSLRRRFLQEARSVAALNHVNIIHVYAWGEDDEGPYIVMEYVSGPPRETIGWPSDQGYPQPPFSLEQRVSSQGQLGLDDAIELIIKIGQAVSYAHANNVIHRDIKPANILLTADEQPKIADFGLARLVRAEESKLTMSGEKLLSLGYGAPEQENNAGLSDERSDIYGLGALLYFAITGQNPRYFRDSDIPSPLRDVLSKAMATDREKRWQTAQSFTEALGAILEHKNDNQPTVKTTWRCKWCDTVNPLSLRYCGECGWDGAEECAECGQRTFFGVQFCGKCGADARSYEAIQMIIARMEKFMQQRQFEKVLSFAGRTLGFEPAGETGHALLKRMQSLREEAEKAIARCERLRERIGIELQSQNYERAKAQIEKYRELSTDSNEFEEELSRLPALLLDRDLARAKTAMRNKDRDTAAEICRKIISRYPENRECTVLLRKIRAYNTNAHMHKFLVLGVLAIILYVLSLPPILRLNPKLLRSNFWRHNFFGPAIVLYNESGSGPLLTDYASLWGIKEPIGFNPYSHPAEEAEAMIGASETLSPALKNLLKSYNKRIAAIEAKHLQRQKMLPEEYLRALDDFKEQRRNAGDFEGWELARRERDRFVRERTLSPTGGVGGSIELSGMRAKHLEKWENLADDHAGRIVKATEKILTKLKEKLSVKTKSGDMDEARRINAEITRITSNAVYISAKKRLERSPRSRHEIP